MLLAKYVLYLGNHLCLIIGNFKYKHYICAENQTFMSSFVIYLKLEKYLSEWLTNSLGDPVRFPVQSNENAIIRRFLQKQPIDKQPETMSPGLTRVVIPESKAKPTATYNYFGPHAKLALIEAIEDLFRQNMWAELGTMFDGTVGLNKTIAAWCEMHGIDDDHTEAVRQKYYRIRKSYGKKGIFLNSLTRKRTDDNLDFVQTRTNRSIYGTEVYK